MAVRVWDSREEDRVRPSREVPASRGKRLEKIMCSRHKDIREGEIEEKEHHDSNPYNPGSLPFECSSNPTEPNCMMSIFHCVIVLKCRVDNKET